MSACCDGSLGDSCRCKCHEPGESAPMVMDTMAGGGRYMLGPIMEGAPVSHVEFGVIGHVEGGKVRITDPGVLESLAAGEPLEVSVGPVAPPADWVIAGTVVEPEQGPQEGQRYTTWPRSPDCRDVNCHKCPGQAWDLEADQAVDCKCDCHPGYAPPAVPAVCPDCGFTWPDHRFGCINE